MKSLFFALVFLSSWSLQAHGAIIGEPITYKSGDFTMQGYLSYDDSIIGKRPGILVVHEWWGLNEYARERARMFAELGYTALAVDMYGDGKQAEHPDEAGKFAAAVRQNLTAETQRFKAAMEVLKKHPTVDAAHIAAVGYCFGGSVALEMARQGLDLDAVVCFHGPLATDHPAAPGVVKARILVCNGGADKLITPESIEAFKKEMQNAGVDYKFISYPGAKHSFTNPGADIYAAKFNIPVGYNQDADKKSWQDMQEFLRESFLKKAGSK
ncbi:MAG: dienelactone hydrolase family protein [Desulfobulbales bacterium]